MDIRSENVRKRSRDIGAAGTVKMAAVKWKKLESGEGMISSDSPGKGMILEKILNRKYKRIIIFENHFGYHNIMMQRPQHLLRNCGDDETLIVQFVL